MLLDIGVGLGKSKDWGNKDLKCKKTSDMGNFGSKC